MKSDSVVIIPTYNEKENIQAIINAVLNITEHQFDVLIVDDNSPDGTGAIVDAMIAQRPERINILKRAGKQGLGTAYIAGFKWAHIPLTSCPSCRPPAPRVALMCRWVQDT